MPKVPQRPLSLGEKLNVERRGNPIYLISPQERKNQLYWRYKKKTAPKDAALFSDLHKQNQHIRAIGNEGSK